MLAAPPTPDPFWIVVIDKFIAAGPAMAGLLLGGFIIVACFIMAYKFGGKIVGAFTAMSSSMQAMAANMETFVDEAKTERHDREKAHAILTDLKRDTSELLHRTERCTKLSQGRVHT